MLLNNEQVLYHISEQLHMSNCGHYHLDIPLIVVHFTELWKYEGIMLQAPAQ